MAKPSITTRATKGSALTWTEGDTNLENLRDATITVKAGAGGTDVVSDLNGTVTLVAGTNVTLSGDNTAKTVTINAAGGSGITDIIQDLTPQLGGNLDVNGKSIVSTGNGNIAIVPSGTGNIQLTPSSGKVTISSTNFPTGTGTTGQVLTTDGTGNASWTTISAGTMSSFNVAGDSGTTQLIENANTLTISGGTGLSSVASATDVITVNLDNTTVTAGTYTLASITVDAQGRITSASNGSAGSGTVTSVSGTGSVSGLSLSGTVTTTGSLTLGGSLDISNYTGTVGGTGFSTYLASPPSIGSTTASTGKFTSLEFKTPVEPVYSLTYAATLTPDAANGSVQKVTLTGNVTLNAFSTPVAGESITLILIQDATGSRTLTSTMKFSGGTKTLSTAANSIDIISIYYDGTTYYASLAKGFA